MSIVVAMALRTVIVLVTALLVILPAQARKKRHPFDLFNHEFHTSLFEAASFSYENCHADPDSFTDRKKVNRLGCHLCHNHPNPPLPAAQDCNRCHVDGKFPKPDSHKTSWVERHQVEAKADPASCQQCHSNQIFCINCHQRRDTVQERVHRRNFKFFHSIQARANPRKCDACHTVDYCQKCHSGKGDSSQ